LKSLRLFEGLSDPTAEGAELDKGILQSDVVLLKNWLPERANEYGEPAERSGGVFSGERERALSDARCLFFDHVDAGGVSS
jgi:hypothetical protein